MEESAKELAWYRTQASSIEKKYLVLEREISYLCNRDKKESSRRKQSTGKLTAINKKLALENDVHCGYLAELLYLINPNSLSSKSSGWVELSATVTTSIRTELNSLKQAREEVDCCKLVMERQNSLLENASQLHEDALVKQEHEEREREKQWEKRLVEVKRSYESEGGDGNNANLQSHLTEPFHELEELRRQKCHLELSNATLSSQLSHAKSAHRVYKNDRACLLSCVCLVAGSLFACHEPIQQLRLQKQLFLRTKNPQLLGYQTKYSQARSHSLPRHLYRGIVHFRIVAIFVLAVCRFKKMKSRSLRLSSSWTNFSPCDNRPGVFPYIGLKANRSKPVSPEGVVSDRDLARWLRSERVLIDVRECFSSLQSSLDVHSHHKHSSISMQPRSIQRGHEEDFKTLVIKCHHDFLNKANVHFQFDL